LIWSAFALARARDGINMAARMPMIAMTTSNSIKVKPRRVWVRAGSTWLGFPDSS